MMRTALVVAMTASLLAGATSAHATPRLDPGKPPASAQQAAQVETRTRPASVGATLDSDAERHLRASFEAADSAHRGTLSREEAQAGGFGWIANHFDAIDTNHVGRVSFDDVKRYLHPRGPGAAAK
jgi:hypothetical protein